VSDTTSYPEIYRGKVLGTDSAESGKLGKIGVEVYPALAGSY
jgi:hypothetical protein